jgi:thiol-disulfide isomerase/thioredoxin
MIRLPKIVGDTWFNSDPLTSADLEGKVVLVDFWTYTCVNCLRTLPYLRGWWNKYRTCDFILIGIHTPEFDFEKYPENVKQVIDNYQVTWPVVLDNDYVNWNNFGNRYWPAKYLADKRGYIVYEHFGEGEYEKTERAIRDLVEEDLGKIPALEPSVEEHVHKGVCFIPTPELYCGYGRGRIGNPTGYAENRVFDYHPPKSLPEDSLSLSGKFMSTYEYVETKKEGAAILLQFQATEVNLVMSPSNKKATAMVLFNSQPILSNIKGADIDENGLINVARPRLYNLLKSDMVIDGVLAVQAVKGGFQAYAFTFSGCVS